MKRLIILFTPLLLTIIFFSPSYAKLTEMSVNGSGMTFYVDFELIRKHSGYVYWYDLIDLLKPDKDGDPSYQGI
jgi:hypothetical protein